MEAQGLIREPVRFDAKPRKRRKLDERIWALLPFLIPLTTAAILRLPPRSRVRRALVLYWVQRSYEIVNRRDFKLALAAQARDVRISWTGGLEAGIPPDLVDRAFHGHEGFRLAWNAILDAFEDLTVEPQEVSDPGGNRLLIGHTSIGTGTASGVPIESRAFTLYTFERGKVAAQEFFVDRDLAERAAGVK